MHNTHDKGGYTTITVSNIYFCTINIPITITYEHKMKCTIKCDCYSYTLSAPTHGTKNFNSFNSTCSHTTSYQKSQTTASSGTSFLEATFTYHLASYFTTKDYNYQHSIYILVVLQEEAEMGGNTHTHTHTYICRQVTCARKVRCLFMSATMTDQCTSKYPIRFTGVTNIYLHSPDNTNGIT